MTECFQWNVAWGHSNLCTSCADTCDGEHCEPAGGCEHACHSLGLPAPPTTTTTTPPGPLQICKMKCADDARQSLGIFYLGQLKVVSSRGQQLYDATES